jgi:transmembrane 9 superfamily member 2/4
MPLTVVGAWLGVKKGVRVFFTPSRRTVWLNSLFLQAISHPVRVNQIPRQIPQAEWWLKPWPSALIAGILPFGALSHLFVDARSRLIVSEPQAPASSSSPTSSRACLEPRSTSPSVSSPSRRSLSPSPRQRPPCSCATSICAPRTTGELLSSRLVPTELGELTFLPSLNRWHWRAFLAGGGSAFWLLAYGLFYWATKLELPGIANKVLFLGYLLLISLLDFFITGAIGFVSCYLFLRVI